MSKKWSYIMNNIIILVNFINSVLENQDNKIIANIVFDTYSLNYLGFKKDKNHDQRLKNLFDSFKLVLPLGNNINIEEVFAKIYGENAGGLPGDKTRYICYNNNKIKYSIKKDFVVDEKQFPVLSIADENERFFYYINPYLSPEHFVHGIGYKYTEYYYSEIICYKCDEKIKSVLSFCSDKLLFDLILLTIEKNIELSMLESDQSFEKDLILDIHQLPDSFINPYYNIGLNAVHKINKNEFELFCNNIHFISECEKKIDEEILQTQLYYECEKIKLSEKLKDKENSLNYKKKQCLDIIKSITK